MDFIFFYTGFQLKSELITPTHSPADK